MNNRCSSICLRLRRHVAQVACGVTLLALGAIAGCSGDSTKAKVTGEVTVDGVKPVEGAITFIPVDGMAPVTGTMIENGEYSALVPFGLMKVEIRVPKKVGEKKLYDTPDSDVMPVMAETLPNKYNAETELELDVKPGVNEHNFELSTKE